MKKLKRPSGTGSQMGRWNVLFVDRNASIKLRMKRLKWVYGDYDQWGAYWGGGVKGQSIWCAWGKMSGDDLTTQVFARATSRLFAKALVREILPNARFF